MNEQTPAPLRGEEWPQKIKQIPWAWLYWRALLASIIWRVAHVGLTLAIIGGLLYFFINHYHR